MPKCCCIIYHANANKIYKQEWIDKCIASIKNQSVGVENFDVFELNYGGTTDKYYQPVGGQLYNFSSIKGKNGINLNHIQAMNHLIAMVLSRGYDIIFNTNLDDYYEPNRFEAQIAAISNGAQLVSSNFHYFNDERKHFKRMDMQRYANIGIQFKRNHNPIAHPVVAYHRSFFEDGLIYNDLLGYEDLDLWKRAWHIGRRFVILPEYLLHYRIHENQITKTYKGL